MLGTDSWPGKSRLFSQGKPQVSLIRQPPPAAHWVTKASAVTPGIPCVKSVRTSVLFRRGQIRLCFLIHPSLRDFGQCQAWRRHSTNPCWRDELGEVGVSKLEVREGRSSAMLSTEWKSGEWQSEPVASHPKGAPLAAGPESESRQSYLRLV